MTSDRLILGAIETVSPLVFLVWILRACPHRRWNFGVGLTFAMAAAVLPAIRAWPGFGTASYVLLSFLMAAVVGTGAGLLLVVLRILRDLIGKSMRLQNGTLCPFCGYRIDYSPEKRCSECGGMFTQDDLSTSPRAGRQWRRAAILSAVLILVSVAGYAVYPTALVWICMKRAVTNPFLFDSLRLGFCFDLNRSGTNRSVASYLTSPSVNERRLAAWEGLYRPTVGIRGDRYFVQRNVSLRSEQFPISLPESILESLYEAMLSDPDEDVRTTAACTLARYAPGRMKRHLPRLLAEASPNGQCALLAELSIYWRDEKFSAIPFLIQALGSENGQVRNVGIKWLRDITGKQYGFDPTAAPEARKAAQARWRTWWQGDNGGE